MYTCRFCHDENETHKLVRSNVKQIECLQCETRQEVCIVPLENMILDCVLGCILYSIFILNLFQCKDIKNVHIHDGLPNPSFYRL